MRAALLRRRGLHGPLAPLSALEVSVITRTSRVASQWGVRVGALTPPRALEGFVLGGLGRAVAEVSAMTRTPSPRITVGRCGLRR
jgi:hypothetical protein